MKIDTLKLVHFAYFHSITSYGIIFQGNSTDNKRIFNIQKKIIRIMAGIKNESVVENYLTNVIYFLL
jgi:hypothetical protein